MILVNNNITQLEEIKSLLTQMPQELFIVKNDILSEATVGQHIRHLLEFYICLKNGVEDGAVCYDNRERDLRIETEIEYALSIIDELIEFLASVGCDRTMVLNANYSMNIDAETQISSSLFRELAYTLDHAIHHLAILKISFKAGQTHLALNENLGVAPSTLRHREECVQ